ncbi:hypothetical protein [Catellatospora paridis]|uniref:hypothetical protein n=1 Tax=Catellatospora paridis TaxID=1617086 RepID=UPI0012D37F14|nr:hypothetical protein [Catellatospora paridis]
MALAEAWYQKEVVWGAAGVVVAVILGVLTLWITIRGNNPRRRLVYSVPTATPVVQTRNRVSGLQVLKDGVPLDNPYVVELTIASRSRRDIPSSAFDQNKPLVLDLGAEVVEVLSHGMTPSGATPWTWDQTNGRQIAVGPCRLGKNERLTIALLVGGRPVVTNPQNPLIDVDLEAEVDNRIVRRTLSTWVSLITGITALITAVATLLSAFSILR